MDNFSAILGEGNTCIVEVIWGIDEICSTEDYAGLWICKIGDNIGDGIPCNLCNNRVFGIESIKQNSLLSKKKEAPEQVCVILRHLKGALTDTSKCELTVTLKVVGDEQERHNIKCSDKGQTAGAPVDDDIDKTSFGFKKFVGIYPYIATVACFMIGIASLFFFVI